MVSSFVIVHLPFIVLPIYFIIYTFIRVSKHWSDGKEPAKTSNSRFAAKLVLTFALSLLELAHVIDYSPNQHYSAEETAFRVGFYVLSALAWLFSSVLVFFDFIRRLESQWRGQRIYWILELFSHIVILILNTTIDSYDYSGREFYTFTLIQITCHALSVVFCLILSYFSLFRPNDFTKTNKINDISLHVPFKPIEDSMKFNEELFKVNFIDCKTRRNKENSSVTYYKFHVKVNNCESFITKTVQEFMVLNQTLEGLGLVLNEPLPDLVLIHFEEQGKELCRYLKYLCRVECMTPELLEFLEIRGSEKESLSRMFLDIHKERGKLEPLIRNGSSFMI